MKIAPKSSSEPPRALWQKGNCTPVLSRYVMAGRYILKQYFLYLNKSFIMFKKDISIRESLAIGILIVSVGIAIYFICKGIPYLGSGLGNFVSACVGHTVTFSTVAGAGITIGSITAIAYVSGTIIKQVKSDPYGWLIPIIGVMGVFVSDISKEVLADDVTGQSILNATFSLGYVVGGIVWVRSDVKYIKYPFAIVCFLAPLIALVTKQVGVEGKSLSDVPDKTYINLLILLVTTSLVILLAYISQKRNSR